MLPVMGPLTAAGQEAAETPSEPPVDPNLTPDTTPVGVVTSVVPVDSSVPVTAGSLRADRDDRANR